MNSNRTCYYKGCAITTRWVELGLTEGMSARRFSASFIVIPTREDAWQEFRPTTFATSERAADAAMLAAKTSIDSHAFAVDHATSR